MVHCSSLGSVSICLALIIVFYDYSGRNCRWDEQLAGRVPAMLTNLLLGVT